MTNLVSAFAVLRRGMLVFYLLAACSAAARAQTNNTAGWIVIPVNEYTALRAKAFPPSPEPAPPSVNATLTRVDYDLRVEGNLAVGRAALTVDVLRDGWVRVPIPAGLMIREARMAGKPVSLVRPAAAILWRQGRSVLELDFALAVTSAAGEERITLPASASAVTRASLAIPRQDVDLKVTGGLIAERSDAEAESHWVAYGRGNEPLSFAWRRKVEERRAPELPLRFRGGLTEIIGLGEDSTSVHAEVTIEVTQGAARQVRVQLPATVTVNQVPGANVTDWEARPGELVISFLEPVEQKASFIIQGETRLARDGKIEIPLLRLLDAERESGGIAVEVLGAGEIKNLQSQGLDRTEAAELGAAVVARQSPSLAAFRFRAGAVKERSLTIEVARYTQQAVLTANIEEARYRVLMSAEGKTLVEARYAVRSSQRSFLRITLPAGAVVWSASLGGRPAHPGRSPEGSLLFPLEKMAISNEASAYVVELVYLSPGIAWSEKGKAALVLPAADLPISRSGLLVYHPPQFRVTAEPGRFRLQPYEEPSSPVLSAAITVQPDAAPQMNAGSAQSAAQVLVDGYRARNEARRPPAAAPLVVTFPAVGPSLFLASELTPENQAPTLELSFQKDRKGGVR